MDQYYLELKKIARRCLARERKDHTLQPTALVHEAWVKLARQNSMDLQNPMQVLALATQEMRRILIDYARAKKAERRGGGAVRYTFSSPELIGETSLESPEIDPIEVLAIEAAMSALESVAPRQAKVMSLRFYAGFEIEEIADALATSPATVKRDLTSARAFLFNHINSYSPPTIKQL